MVVGGSCVVHVVPGNETHHCGRWNSGLLPPAAPRPQNGHDGVVQLLLSAGAAKDGNRREGKKGTTPLSVASQVFVGHFLFVGSKDGPTFTDYRKLRFVLG